MLRPKKNSYKESDNVKKIPVARKFPPPPPLPHNVSKDSSLTHWLLEIMRKNTFSS